MAKKEELKKVDFNPEGKYEANDKVVLTPTSAAEHHDSDFEVRGHQATHLIRKGYATFKEIKKPIVKSK